MGDGWAWSEEFRAGASPANLADLERELAIALPESFKNFLLASDGLELVITRPLNNLRSCEEYLSIWSVETILDEFRSFELGRRRPILVPFSAFGNSDVFLFDSSRSSRSGEFFIREGDHDEILEWCDARIVAESFDEWFSKVNTFIENNCRFPYFNL
jgi:hypothetical protein